MVVGQLSDRYDDLWKPCWRGHSFVSIVLYLLYCDVLCDLIGQSWNSLLLQCKQAHAHWHETVRFWCILFCNIYVLQKYFMHSKLFNNGIHSKNLSTITEMSDVSTRLQYCDSGQFDVNVVNLTVSVAVVLINQCAILNWLVFVRLWHLLVSSCSESIVLRQICSIVYDHCFIE